MGDWRPEAEETLDGRRIFLWIVPAVAGGRWALTDAGGGDWTLEIEQRYQEVTGTLTGEGRVLELARRRSARHGAALHRRRPRLARHDRRRGDRRRRLARPAARLIDRGRPGARPACAWMLPTIQASSSEAATQIRSDPRLSHIASGGAA